MVFSFDSILVFHQWHDLAYSEIQQPYLTSNRRSQGSPGVGMLLQHYYYHFVMDVLEGMCA